MKHRKRYQSGNRLRPHAKGVLNPERGEANPVIPIKPASSRKRLTVGEILSGISPFSLYQAMVAGTARRKKRLKKGRLKVEVLEQ